MKQNVTLALEKDLLRKLKIMAAKKDSSITGMLREELKRIVDRENQYERRKTEALKYLDSGFHFGGKIASREELHER